MIPQALKSEKENGHGHTEDREIYPVPAENRRDDPEGAGGEAGHLLPVGLQMGERGFT